MFDSIQKWFTVVSNLLSGNWTEAGAAFLGIQADKAEQASEWGTIINDAVSGKGLVTTIMYPEVTLDGNGSTYSDLFGSIYHVILGVAITLIVLKVAYKAFQTYALGDNDPSADPIYLLKKMMQALIVAIGFNEILYYILYSFVSVIVQLITNAIGEAFLNALVGSGGSSFGIGDYIIKLLTGSLTLLLNPFSILFLILWIISFIILYVKFIIRSVELLYLRIGFPLACVGIIDSDYGVFKPFVKKFFQAAASIIIQVGLLYLSLGIIEILLVDSNITGFQSFIMPIFACAFLWSAFSAPKVLAEFLLWSGGGGGAASMINLGSNITRTIKMFMTK